MVPLTATAASNTSAATGTQYVSDNLVITLRTGQGNQFQILKTLNSGAKLTVLQQTPTGYSEVRTSDGTEGWVRTQYLSNEPPAAMRLTKAESQLSKLKDELDKTQQALAALRKQKTQLDSQYSKLQNEHKSTSAELTKLSPTGSWQGLWSSSSVWSSG
ncbi:MAG: TIGR04211 family SH3 domain-containing protein [Gammaproteobacteria bacterium]